MFTLSVRIERPIEQVWSYFTIPTNWSCWYGGGVKAVVPGWESGGRIMWELGGDSEIEKVVPGQEVCLIGTWMDTTWSFKPEGAQATLVEVHESDPKRGASFSDGGAAHKANWEKTLLKLKGCVEAGP